MNNDPSLVMPLADIIVTGLILFALGAVALRVSDLVGTMKKNPGPPPQMHPPSGRELHAVRNVRPAPQIIDWERDIPELK